MSNHGEVVETVIETVGEIDFHKVVIRRCLANSTYEYRRWLYLVIFPISLIIALWVIIKKITCRIALRRVPNTNFLFFDGLGVYCRKIREGSASWRSLDVIYNYKFGCGYGISGLIDDFWIGMINAQAVRGRLQLVKKEVRAALLAHYDAIDKNEVRIASLGAGSVQGVIQVIADLKSEGIIVKLLLIDLDPTALEYAVCWAVKLGIEDQIQTHRTSVSAIVKLSKDFKPHVIEMLGLLDYIQQDKAIKLVGKIRESLEPNGIFLTCNVRRNIEMFFLKWVINWSMIYRSSFQLAEIAIKAEFVDVRVVYEPHGIHGLLAAQKN